MIKKKELKLTIITVTYNSAKTVKDCINSVLSQNYPFIEYIIIDGNSTDETVNIVRSFGDKIDTFITEDDKGMYDALNKGINKATGDIIGLLHSDDIYAEKDTLAKVAEIFQNSDIDACYSDLVYIEETGSSTLETKNNNSIIINRKLYKIRRHWRSGKFNTKRFYWGWMPAHPTFFVRRSIYKKYGGFNLCLGSAADYELMLRFLLKYLIKVAYIPKVLVYMRTGGISNASFGNRYKANNMDRMSWKVNGLKPYPWTLLMKPIRKIPQYIFKSYQ